MPIKLKRIAALISPRWREPSKCASCGCNFTCDATLMGCWCSEIQLTDEQREDLRSRYSGCLCRACLEAAASANATSEIKGRRFATD